MLFRSQLARAIGDSGRLLLSFSVMLVGFMMMIGAVYAMLVGVTQWLCGDRGRFRKLFSSFAFTALPLAFAYHLAHNLSHLLREGPGIESLITDPFGIEAVALSMAEKHARHEHLWISQDVLFAIQAGLMVFGFWVAVQVIRHRGAAVLPANTSLVALKVSPMLVFAVMLTSFHLWMLMQPMTMRM